MESVKEDSTAYLTISFYDKDGDLEAPSAIFYQIDDVMSGTAIRAEAEITPAASSKEITLTPADNVIVDEDNVEEKRRVTVRATYGASDGVKSEYDYLVTNLSQVV